MHIHEDLEFWGIDKNLMDACCALTHYPEFELSQKESNRDKMSRMSEAKQAKEEYFGETWMGKTRSFLWNLTEYPEKNLFARVTINIDFALSCATKFINVMFLCTNPLSKYTGVFPNMKLA